MATDPIRLFYHAGFASRRRPVAMLLNWLRHGVLHSPSYNVGDMISPVVVGGLAERPVKHVYAWQRRKLVAIGSVLPAALDGDVVWGAGLMVAGSRRHLIGKSRISIQAVRGPLTRRELLAIGLSCPEVYGDPALLLPLLFPVSRSANFPVGIVPHIKQHAEIQPLCQPLVDHGAIVISPRRPWQEFIRMISQCRLIISTSLHGVILADAYRIPAILMRHDQFLHNDSFKWEDYYESTSRRLAWRSSEELLRCPIDELLSIGQEIVEPRLDLGPLLKAFPFPLRSDLCTHGSLMTGHDPI